MAKAVHFSDHSQTEAERAFVLVVGQRENENTQPPPLDALAVSAAPPPPLCRTQLTPWLAADFASSKVNPCGCVNAEDRGSRA